MTTLLAFVFVLGVLVFFHEAGHFFVAKWVGVRVKVFSLGFPPKLIGRTWGDTEYRIGAVPLGGYVKMAGDTASELTGSPDEYLSRSKKERFAILLAGPLMNFVLAVVLFTILFGIGIEMPVWLDEPAIVQYIAEGSPGADANVELGDHIVAIDGEPVDTWGQAFEALAQRRDRSVSVTLERNGRERESAIHVGENGDAGLFPAMQPHVIRVEPRSPAERAGIRVGDAITKVDGQPILHFSQFSEAVASGEGDAITLELARGDETVERKVTPTHDGERWIIGIQYVPSATTLRESANLLIALTEAVAETAGRTAAVFGFLGRLITSDVSSEGIVGPIGIAGLSGESARRGARTLLEFMAVLSINLAILNLLPIPLLDGGHATIILVEGLAGRDFSFQTKERILQLGFVFLLILMVTVFYLDLSRIW